MKIKRNYKVVLTPIVLSLTALFSSCQKEDLKITDINYSNQVSNEAEQDTTTLDSIEREQKPTEDKGEVKDSVIIETPPITSTNPIQQLPAIGTSAYYIENILPKGYVRDGSRDYTKYIQLAINTYSELVFPDFPLLINDEGLNIPSNRTIHFPEGSLLKLKPSSKSGYSIISINNKHNITLVNPNILGDRYGHLGTGGEWGMGINIQGSSDILIYRARILNCWGDGIYIGKSSTATNKNIKLIQPYCKGNRRDGITIIDADGLDIISPYTGFSDGTAPYSGINIEPNDYTSEIKNINIIDPVSENNKGYGIQIGLANLYGKGSKDVSVKVQNHIDKGSNTAFLATCRNSKQVGSEKISGSIIVNSPSWQKNSEQPLYVFFPEPNMKFILTKPKVMNLSGSYLSELETRTLLEHRKSIWKPTEYTISF